ncbi:MAG TPA: hypothetical protein VK283_01160 [Acidimicrobiales bacterium]|nr:hypothetical protein [Acidimicrobiales bacterium]
MTDDDSGAPGGAAPKLTIGQRILTALPNLQREPAPSAPTRPTRSARASTGATDTTPGADADVAGADEAPDNTGSARHSANGTASGLGGLLRGSTSRPGPRARTRSGEVLDKMSREEIAHRIKKLDDRERFLALSSAPLGVAVGVGLTLITIHLNPAAGHAKHVAPSTIYLEGGARILLSGVVVAAALTRRRSLVGFALLFLGTSMGAPLFALPFWALGGYLIWRVFKFQKALSARNSTSGKAATGGGRIPANPRAAGRAGAAAARQRAQNPRRRGRKEPAPAGPTPSKRYTPPRPTRPRPPAPPS